MDIINQQLRQEVLLLDHNSIATDSIIQTQKLQLDALEAEICKLRQLVKSPISHTYKVVIDSVKRENNKLKQEIASLREDNQLLMDSLKAKWDSSDQ